MARVVAQGEHDVFVCGAADAMMAAAATWKAPLVRVDDPATQVKPGTVAVFEPTGSGDERVEIRALRWAAHALQHDEAWLHSALVTGPIHKARLISSGFAFTGHTDFLGHLVGNPHPVMAFVGGTYRVVLATVHLPLRAVPDALTASRITHTIRTAHQALQRDLGLDNPTLLVCGLNPHAGDQGALGHEEIEVIGPAVEALRAEGLSLVGPISAEAAFTQMGRGTGDMIVAMYHDQGLAPLKAVDFGRSVNWTLGLPFIRTSVDHGTADDLVGTGHASTSSLEAAMRWARTLQQRRLG